jgi:NADH-quinone oxidoreductase subunit L
MTHAFFKALLFLGAGSVIIGMHHEQDMRKMGGLRKYMPITWITMWIGTLALVGTPFFAGFYSKDTIIEAVAHHAGEHPGSLTFFGEERFREAHAHDAITATMRMRTTPTMPTRITTTTAMAMARTSRTSRHGW